MYEITFPTERPSVPPATAGFRVSAGRPQDDAFVARHRGWVVQHGVVNPALRTVELPAPTAAPVNGRSVSVRVCGTKAAARLTGDKQIDAGGTGVGGAPPRGRPS